MTARDGARSGGQCSIGPCGAGLRGCSRGSGSRRRSGRGCSAGRPHRRLFPRPSAPEPDPRADELRQRIAEAREVVDERDTFEEAEMHDRRGSGSRRRAAATCTTAAARHSTACAASPRPSNARASAVPSGQQIDEQDDQADREQSSESDVHRPTCSCPSCPCRASPCVLVLRLARRLGGSPAAAPRGGGRLRAPRAEPAERRPVGGLGRLLLVALRLPLALVGLRRWGRRRGRGGSRRRRGDREGHGRRLGRRGGRGVGCGAGAGAGEATAAGAGAGAGGCGSGPGADRARAARRLGRSADGCVDGHAHERRRRADGRGRDRAGTGALGALRRPRAVGNDDDRGRRREAGAVTPATEVPPSTSRRR